MQPRADFYVEDDKAFLVKTNDAEPVIDGVAAMSDLIRSQSHKARVNAPVGAKYVGSIDPITAANLKKQSGLKIGTKEFAQFVKKQIRSNLTRFKADV